MERISDLRGEIIHILEEPVREFLQEKGYTDEFQEEEIEILLDAIFKESENYADHQEFWESERDALVSLAHDLASESYSLLEQETESYLSACESLQNQLRSRKAQLKRKYGIVSETDPDDDFVRAV